MRVGDVMSRDVQTVAPDDTVAVAARLMAEHDIGILPVFDGTRVVGVLTDRDIVIRTVAAGKEPGACTVDDILTEEVHYCVEDESVDSVARRMGDLRIRRMPVLDLHQALLGMISLGDIASRTHRNTAVANALRKLYEPRDRAVRPSRPESR